MSKRVNDNSIQINGEKFKTLLEGATGKTLKEISLENGFSDSFLRMVVKSGTASPSARTVAKLYGIEPSAYIYIPDIEPCVENRDDKQLSIDDLESIKRDELKELFKQAIREEGLKESELKAIIKEAVREEITEFKALIYQRGFDDGYARAVGDGYGKKEGK